MRLFITISILIILLGSAGGYVYWAQQRPDVGIILSDLSSEISVNQGQPSDRGNLLGVQPLLFASDYQSRETLHLKLAAYLEKARDEGLLNAKTIAILPEHIGTWLVAAGEKPEFYKSDSLQEAVKWLAASHPLGVPQALLSTPSNKDFSDALFRLKAAQMADDYQNLFSGLARDFGITLVAGSIVLPEPRNENGVLQIGEGPLYNISVVYGADGKALGQPQRKVYPSSRERSIIAAAPLEQLHTFATPAGNLAVLIGTDSWYPASYVALAKLNTELLAVPGFVKGKTQWNKPWKGYKHATKPQTPTLADKSVSEGEAWQQLAIPNQLQKSGARAGAMVFMRGQLWRMGIDGRSVVSDGQKHANANDSRSAQLVNLWL